MDDLISPRQNGTPKVDGQQNESDRKYSNASDEARQTLEVSFNNDDPWRRKSSLAPNSTNSPRPNTGPRRFTNCFVHSLLTPHNSHLPVIPRTVSSDDVTLNEDGHEAGRLGDKDPNDDAQLLEVEEGDGEAKAVASRLLTKKQIGDMAFGIRELAKKLAHIKIKLKVKNIFVLCKAHDEGLIKDARDVAEWLLAKDPVVRVYVEHTLEDNTLFDAHGLLAANSSAEGRLRYWTNEMCAEKPGTFDIVLALGGDGTVLYASWLFQRVVPPVLAFSLGSLGFLTKFDFSKYQQTIDKTFTDGITISLRLRFEATVMRSQKRDRNDCPKKDLVEELIGEEMDDHHTHQPDGTHNILNEVVIDRGPNPTMSTSEIFGDDEHFTTVQADGVCIATPTGSTAYNLAAGGSLCHPDNPVILLTAICAHTLSFRPIILPDTIVLRVGVPYDARTNSWASFDGRERVELLPGDYVTISASRFPFPSVLPQNGKSREWIDSISRTLQWNSRQRQKSFKEWS